MAARFALNILVLFVVINAAFAAKKCNPKYYSVNIKRFVDDNRIRGYLDGLAINLRNSADNYYSFTDDILKNYRTPLWVTLTVKKQGTFWTATMSLQKRIPDCNDLFITTTSGKDRDQTFRRVFAEFFKKFQ